jgi:DNA-binding HxlR family transcriptional regulator
MRAVDGISQRVLATTLRNLERDGIVARGIYSEVPPKVEYTPTVRGSVHSGGAARQVALERAAGN